MSEEKAPKKSAREVTQYWLVRLLIVTVPALLSYCQAKTEAGAEARKAKKQAEHVEDKAGAGYDEIVKAVKHLDEEFKDYRKELYSMRGHIEAIEARLSMRIRAPRPIGDPENPDTASGSGALPAPVPHPAPDMQPLDVAADLDQAAAKHGVAKK